MILKHRLKYSQDIFSDLDHLELLNSFPAPPFSFWTSILSVSSGHFGPTLKHFSANIFSGSGSLPAPRLHATLGPGLFSDIPKTSSDIPTAFSDRPFLFRFPKAWPESWKYLCSYQALSTLRKSCFRSREHFARSRDRSRRGILLGAGAVKINADNAPREA